MQEDNQSSSSDTDDSTTLTSLAVQAGGLVV